MQRSSWNAAHENPSVPLAVRPSVRPAVRSFVPPSVRPSVRLSAAVLSLLSRGRLYEMFRHNTIENKKRTFP